MVDEGFRAEPRVEASRTLLRSRERIPLRVMILPFLHLGPKAKGWRAPGSRRAVVRKTKGRLSGARRGDLQSHPEGHLRLTPSVPGPRLSPGLRS